MCVCVGVVFENVISNGPLPAHIVYKIRQNASFTATTKSVRDKFWHPGPGKTSEGYYQFGFVWLQVFRRLLRHAASTQNIFTSIKTIKRKKTKND